MNDAIMFSVADAAKSGFDVFGQYDVPQAQPKWEWKSEFRQIGPDQLTITAYNVHPKGAESKAVETLCERA